MRVYIAGPYTGGDVARNVANAILIGDAVLKLGHTPHVPHLNHFWHLLHPGGYEQWMGLDLEWLAVCDVLLRLPGESPGADREVAEARRLGLPVATLKHLAGPVYGESGDVAKALEVAE